VQVGEDEEVRALRAGDEATFKTVVSREHAMLFRLARAHVHDDAAAADVVQETWVAAIKGLDRFEGRASLRSWLASIAVNLARRRGARDARVRPIPELSSRDDDHPGGWPPDRFRGATARWPGHWSTFPADWSSLPDEALASAEVMNAVRGAIDALPARQRSVVVLRDVLGWTSSEVCEALAISGGNERVLLHRGRSTVRRSLEAVLGP
jgi:RNA polymerase sigma-70 factor (ECF subfamily)